MHNYVRRVLCRVMSSFLAKLSGFCEENNFTREKLLTVKNRYYIESVEIFSVVTTAPKDTLDGQISKKLKFVELCDSYQSIYRPILPLE